VPLLVLGDKNRPGEVRERFVEEFGMSPQQSHQEGVLEKKRKGRILRMGNIGKPVKWDKESTWSAFCGNKKRK